MLKSPHIGLYRPNHHFGNIGFYFFLRSRKQLTRKLLIFRLLKTETIPGCEYEWMTGIYRMNFKLKRVLMEYFLSLLDATFFHFHFNWQIFAEHHELKIWDIHSGTHFFVRCREEIKSNFLEKISARNLKWWTKWWMYLTFATLNTWHTVCGLLAGWCL